jgi:hypothetical protein
MPSNTDMLVSSACMASATVVVEIGDLWIAIGEVGLPQHGAVVMVDLVAHDQLEIAVVVHVVRGRGGVVGIGDRQGGLERAIHVMRAVSGVISGVPLR